MQETLANTVERCRRVIRWLAHIEQPFGEGTDGEPGGAESDILHLVGDALEHAEKAVRQVGSLDDIEVVHG